MNIYYVYEYLREDLTPYYVGKGKNTRWRDKHSVAVPPKDRVRFVATELTELQAFDLEKQLILDYGRKDLGTGPLRNLTSGGEGISGFKHSNETKKLLRQHQLGKPKSEEAIRKQQETRKRNNKSIGGWTHSEEWKSNMSKIMSGKKQSDEHLAKLSAVRKGKKQSPELVAKRAAALRGRPQERIICPHCKKEGGLTGMKRYHFDNCKHQVCVLPNFS